MRKTWVPSLDREDALEEGVATHSSSLAWRIPMVRGAWWVMVHGVARVRHSRAIKHSIDKRHIERFLIDGQVIRRGGVWVSEASVSEGLTGGFVVAGSLSVAHGLSRPMACGIFLDQGSNLSPLHWHVDSESVGHQGSLLNSL